MARPRRYQEPRDERITLRAMGWGGHLIVMENGMGEKGRKQRSPGKPQMCSLHTGDEWGERAYFDGDKILSI